MLGILDRIFPEYANCFSSVFIQTSRQLLKQYPEPEELAAVDLTELAGFLNQHSRGRLGLERSLAALNQHLDAQIAVTECSFA